MDFKKNLFALDSHEFLAMLEGKKLERTYSYRIQSGKITIIYTFSSICAYEENYSLYIPIFGIYICSLAENEECELWMDHILELIKSGLEHRCEIFGFFLLLFPQNERKT